MLTRLYVDNFRCLANFELTLDEKNVFLGANGTGKTSVFEVLRRIQALVARGERVDEWFPSRDLSIELERAEQRFELDLQVGNHSYCYVLIIEHDREHHMMRIAEESLAHDDRPIFEFRRGDAQLYHDDYERGPAYPFDWSRSGVGALNERPDNRKLTRFKNAVADFVIASPCPPIFGAETKSEDDFLDPLMRNFVGWYRHASHENMGAIVNLFQALRESLPGFDSLDLVDSGEFTRTLKVSFRQPIGKSENSRFVFNQLSDGQRMLMALYSLIHLSPNRRACLFLDEPDNFLALHEVQPWLVAADEQCGEALGQLVLISHHPSTINYLAGASGRWFSRDGTGPVRVSAESPRLIDGLSFAEMIERGWEK